jgi:hypothetical protein
VNAEEGEVCAGDGSAYAGLGRGEGNVGVEELRKDGELIVFCWKLFPLCFILEIGGASLGLRN